MQNLLKTLQKQALFERFSSENVQVCFHGQETTLSYNRNASAFSFTGHIMDRVEFCPAELDGARITARKFSKRAMVSGEFRQQMPSANSPFAVIQLCFHGYIAHLERCPRESLTAIDSGDRHIFKRYMLGRVLRNKPQPLNCSNRGNYR
jgi:hypothetical protein